MFEYVCLLINASVNNCHSTVMCGVVRRDCVLRTQRKWKWDRDRVLHHRVTLLKHAKLNNMFSFGKSIKLLNHIKLLTDLSGNPFTNTYSGRRIFESTRAAIPCRHISTYISVYLYTYIHTYELPKRSTSYT